jgi:hypothetical protein
MTTWQTLIENPPPVHPAAEKFPMMSDRELTELGRDIKENGLKHNLILYRDADRKVWLLDGRNRLEAAARCQPPAKLTVQAMLGQGESTVEGWGSILKPAIYGHPGDGETPWQDSPFGPNMDPWVYVISANAHRRHLTAAQKREAIAMLLQADPTKSDRSIAATIGASPSTVGTVRAETIPTVQIGQLPRTGADGKTRRLPEPIAAAPQPEEPKEPMAAAPKPEEPKGIPVDPTAGLPELRRSQDGAVLDPLPVALRRALFRLRKAHELDSHLPAEFKVFENTLRGYNYLKPADSHAVLRKAFELAQSHRQGAITDIEQALAALEPASGEPIEAKVETALVTAPVTAPQPIRRSWLRSSFSRSAVT